MKTLLVIGLVVLPTLMLAAGQTNQPANPGSGALSKAEAAVAQLEREWAEAVKRQDTQKIDRLQAEEYVFTGPGGEVWTKSRALETIKSGDLQIDSFELSDIQVRVYGDTAVITLRVEWNGRFRGAEISGPQRMTDVYVKRDGRWQCVASQATRIRQP